MPRFLLACMMSWILSASSHAQCCSDPWTVNFSRTYRFRPFGVPPSGRRELYDRWRAEQGLVFISPDILAVYQVLEEPNPQPVMPRDLSGGGGRYRLKIVFLSIAENGKKLRDLELVTVASTFSQVFAAQPGSFVVRTGNLLRLFSSSFEELRSTLLPVDHNSWFEAWEVASDPSNRFLIALHEKAFVKDGAYESTLYKLDFDTMHLELYSDLMAEQMALHPDSAFAQRLPRSVLKTNEFAFTAAVGGGYIAAEIRKGTRGEGKPDRVILYNQDRHETLCSIPLTDLASFWPYVRLYAVSPEGTLALIRKDQLTVWVH
jgi:hypothetical protein